MQLFPAVDAVDESESVRRLATSASLRMSCHAAAAGSSNHSSAICIDINS